MPRWTLWKPAFDQSRGRYTKKPCSPSGHAWAAQTDPECRLAFADALSAHQANPNLGLGFVLTGEDGLIGIDLDHALDDGGQPLPWAAAIVSRLGTYTEISPGGRGLRMFLAGAVPLGCRNKRGGLGADGLGAIEIYAKDRYLTITGRRLVGSGS